MRALATSLFLLVGSGAALAQPTGVGPIEVTDTLIDIAGADHRVSMDCKGRRVVVAGSKHVVNLTGVCASLDVSGDSNQVTATLIPGAPLEVAGSRHQVRWRSSGQVRTDVSGDSHQVVRVTN